MPADLMLAPTPFRLRTKRHELPDTWTLTLDPVDGGIAQAAPGQFNMLSLAGIGESAISYSGLDPNGSLIHTVRVAGHVTEGLCRSRPGDVIGVRGPFGVGWPVEEAAGRDVLFVAGGIGLAPLRPAIRHVLDHRDSYGRVAVCIGARSPDDLLYEADLHSWRGRFDVHVDVTVDVASPGWHGNVGLVTELLAQAPVDPGATDAFVCGPEIMMRFTATDLVSLGVPEARILLSLERNMRCATATCGTCQIGPYFACREGPVLAFHRIRGWIEPKEI